MNILDEPDTSMDELYRLMEENGFSCLDEMYEYLMKQHEENYECYNTEDS